MLTHEHLCKPGPRLRFASTPRLKNCVHQVTRFARHAVTSVFRVGYESSEWVPTPTLEVLAHTS
jgi:hypothetical protein